MCGMAAATTSASTSTALSTRTSASTRSSLSTTAARTTCSTKRAAVSSPCSSWRRPQRRRQQARHCQRRGRQQRAPRRVQQFTRRVRRGGGHNVGVDKHHVGSGHVDCLTYDHVGLKTHVVVYTCASICRRVFHRGVDDKRIRKYLRLRGRRAAHTDHNKQRVKPSPPSIIDGSAPHPARLPRPNALLSDAPRLAATTPFSHIASPPHTLLSSPPPVQCTTATLNYRPPASKHSARHVAHSDALLLIVLLILLLLLRLVVIPLQRADRCCTGRR